ncbi:unnamed protein product [Phytomonas sp. EM1]|nr:unnamed protein product [Phytomonas sp. EM1]|eukprot:CCW65128.1 unnamed protein product [Phytomonas sp. isolate EM1]
MQPHSDLVRINTIKEKHPNLTQTPSNSGNELPSYVSERKVGDLSVSREDIQRESRNDTPGGDAISDSLAQLAKVPFDLKQWINAALTGLSENDKTKIDSTNICENNKSSNKGVDASNFMIRSEGLIDRLITRVQSHIQDVGRCVDEMISQTAVRLPRSILELSRMINETQEITSVLEGLQGTVKLPRGNLSSSTRPSLAIGSEEYVQRLHELKETQTKLKRCLNVLSKATSVNTNIEKIDNAIGRSALQRFSDAPMGTAVNELRKSYTALTKVINLIRQVQNDLQYLRKVDPSYGEKYQVVLEKYEEILEKMLEHECVERLVEHQAESAVEFFQPLKMIGRMDAVLTSYVKRVGHLHAERIQQMFCVSEENAEPSSVSPSRAAEVIRKQLVPSINVCLATEFDFLCDLEEKTITYQCKIDAEGSLALFEDTTSRFDVPASNISLHSSEYGSKKEMDSILLTDLTPAMNYTSNTAFVVQAMEQITGIISEAFNIPMMQLLQHIPSNKDLIDCYEGIKLIKVLANKTGMAGKSPPNEVAAADTLARVDDPAGPPPSNICLREQYAAQASLQALRKFTVVFRDSSLMKIFRDFTDMRLHISMGLKPQYQTPDARRSLICDSARLSRLSDALVGNLRDVLRFFPEETMPLCVKSWYTSLLSFFLSTTPTGSEMAFTKRGDTSQAVLSQLYFTTKVVKPALLTLQRDMEAFLTSTDVRELYADMAGALLQILSTELWKPILTASEVSTVELQTSLKHIILVPVLEKTSHYTELPVWRPVRPPGLAKEGEGQQQLQRWLHAVNFSPGQVTPSEPVRDLGEAILEIPLKLEALRAASVDLLGIEETGVLPFSTIDGIDELFFEETESWLDGIVYAAVDDFVRNKVLQVKVEFGDLKSWTEGEAVAVPETSEEATDELLKQGVSIALQQLLSDLDYMKNVLSAVSDNHFDNVENVLVKLNTLLSTCETSKMLRGKIFKVCELINEYSE